MFKVKREKVGQWEWTAEDEATGRVRHFRNKERAEKFAEEQNNA